AQNGKLTFAGLHGIEATKRRIEALTTETVGHLQATQGDTAFLVELVRRMSARRS
ncbi:MAG: polyprenyl synthetase family protein, partial [Verrucomicrobia bacterium]|nr:polyprenyl synthetase family protein [Verrucomicrobiota bacterium]